MVFFCTEQAFNVKTTFRGWLKTASAVARLPQCRPRNPLRREEGVWEGGRKLATQKAAALGANEQGPSLVFIIETIARLNKKQMIAVVISLTKVIFPFKMRHQRTLLPL